ncbi:MAG: phage tail tape measure protein, partial [Magnetococcales bacterium]|nr:phage tail tape measure protein [Magnetococcales bacterium]
MPNRTSRMVEIIFSGKDRLSREIRAVEGKLNDVSEGASDLASQLLLLEGALLAVGTAFAVSAFNKASQFESALVDLNKVLSDSEKTHLPALEQEVVGLSEIYGQSAASILGSTANFKQAGYSVLDASNLTKTAMDLVIAGDVEATEASEMLVASLKGFGAPATEAGRLLDILNAVSNQYATSVVELGRGMAGISPVAKTMGFSMEETAG